MRTGNFRFEGDPFRVVADGQLSLYKPFCNVLERTHRIWLGQALRQARGEGHAGTGRPGDPKALIEWFNGLKKSYPRLKVVVKYLKAWYDWKRNKMPSGLAMTILAANTIQRIASNKRDDILLRDILVEIEKDLKDKFECMVPVLPHDDLFGEYAKQGKTA